MNGLSAPARGDRGARRPARSGSPAAFARGTSAASVSSVDGWGWPMAIAAPRSRAIASRRANCSRIDLRPLIAVEEDLALGRRQAERQWRRGSRRSPALVRESRKKSLRSASTPEDGVHRAVVGREAGAHVVVDADRAGHRGERRGGRRAELAWLHAGAQGARSGVLPADRLHRQVAEDLVPVAAERRDHLRRLLLEGEHRVGERDAEPLEALDLLDAPAEVVDHQRPGERPRRGPGRRRRGRAPTRAGGGGIAAPRGDDVLEARARAWPRPSAGSGASAAGSAARRRSSHGSRYPGSRNRSPRRRRGRRRGRGAGRGRATAEPGRLRIAGRLRGIKRLSSPSPARCRGAGAPRARGSGRRSERPSRGRSAPARRPARRA